MRLIAGTVLVAAGALLVGVAEVARSFSSRDGAGEWAATGGLVAGAAGLALLVLELYPPRWLSDAAAPRRPGGPGNEPRP